MNRKLLICGAIMVGLVLTACSKKEAPENNDKQSPEQTTQQNVASEQLQSINKDGDNASAPMAEPEHKHAHDVPPEHHSKINAEQPPKMVEVEREQTANTTTEIRREYKSETPKKSDKDTTPVTSPEVHVEKVSTASAPEVVKPKHHQAAKPQSGNLSEDDAVAAAMSAAKPALN